ncbi:hypothetical protein [Asanoa iriomotensis]|uniref:Uncharacterized protein n=1 Tax=Asanoa iriomotensis TaxID=234613 RepID=A0ABQ4C6C5_9ACTN|nr:hypothetical protein [Asanoa iriomotensis]GIF58337.1 hypothetical protein Air01nite_44320 [Asanoa iriomotensis]
MAHGEADPGCVEAGNPPQAADSPDPDEPAPGRQIRRICAEPTAERTRDGDDDAEPPEHVILFGRAPACRSERPGWAGAHRHGAVRPRRRATRRERPPDRWC